MFFRDLKKSFMRIPMKDKKRARGSQKAIANGSESIPSPTLSSTSPTLGLPAIRSSACDYLDITGTLVVFERGLKFYLHLEAS